MTDQEYDRAMELKITIDERKNGLVALDLQENSLDLPEEMFHRHQEEKRAFLQCEITRLEAAFVAL